MVNGGAESEEPVIALRPEDAEDLGISLSSFDIIEVELASGKTHNLISRDKVRVELLDDQTNTLSHTYAYLAIDENLSESLITDATIDELGIVVISFKKVYGDTSTIPQIQLGIVYLVNNLQYEQGFPFLYKRYFKSIKNTLKIYINTFSVIGLNCQEVLKPKLT